MRDLPPRRWQTWRLTLAARPPVGRTPHPGAPRMIPPPDRRPPTVPPELRAEAPGPDGVRRGLVEHVRRLIEAGEYDTPDRWAAAEERLFDRVADGR